GTSAGADMITHASLTRFLNHRGVLATVLGLALLTPTRAAAQAVYGSVSGVVTDTSGAVVPGATVTITSVERKTIDTVVTNESGLYLKERLVPGTYEVKAELPGFKTAVFPDIKVNVDTQTKLNIKLELGQVTEAVTVAGFSPVLKTDRADVASSFDAKFGQATAGVISVQTKSGTNQMHGSAFEFHLDDRLQSRNPFSQASPDPLTGKFIPETTRNQFGGALGGPLQRDRVFIFGDY